MELYFLNVDGLSKEKGVLWHLRPSVKEDWKPVEDLTLGLNESSNIKKIKDGIAENLGEYNFDENGSSLNNLSKQHSLKKKMAFLHENIYKHRWHQRTKNLRPMIDCIITRQNTKGSLQDIRAYRRLKFWSNY